MSFAPNNTPEMANQDFWANPERAMRLALQQRGMDPTRNYYAQRLISRAGELIPLAFSYGASPDNFLDFVNQYAGSQVAGTGGQFSNANIRQRVASTYNTADGGSEDQQNIYDWLRSGTPDEQKRNFLGLQALNQRGRNPALASVAMDRYGNQVEDWITKYMQDMTGGNTGGATNWMDAYLGRATTNAMGQGNTGAGDTVGITDPGWTSGAADKQAQQAQQSQAAQATAAAANPYAGGSSSGAAANAGGGTYAQQTGQTVATPVNGYGVVNPTNLKYQQYMALINQLRQAQASNQKVQIGNIAYDPSRDTERWWHGDAANRFRSGESSINRIIRWLTEAAQGKRDHVAGQVDPNDPTGTFGRLVEQLWGQIRERDKGTRDPNQYGFWNQS